MATGYEDIDKVMQQQNTLLQQQEAEGNKIIDLGLQKAQAQVDKQKAEYEQEAEKSGKQLYTDYRKASNPYGANAEQLASQGLNRSGYAESTQTNLYNTYQKNATTLMVETQKLKADADFQMNQAMIDADVQKAQNAMAIYQQKAQLILQEYEMKFSRDQWEWQKQQAELDRQYQASRDAVSDAQWQKQYQLSLSKKSNTSGDYWYSDGTEAGNEIGDNAYIYLEELENKDLLTAVAELTKLQTKGLISPTERAFIESKLNASKFSKQ